MLVSPPIAKTATTLMLLAVKIPRSNEKAAKNVGKCFFHELNLRVDTARRLVVPASLSAPSSKILPTVRQRFMRC